MVRACFWMLQCLGWSSWWCKVLWFGETDSALCFKTFSGEHCFNKRVKKNRLQWWCKMQSIPGKVSPHKWNIYWQTWLLKGRCVATHLSTGTSFPYSMNQCIWKIFKHKHFETHVLSLHSTLFATNNEEDAFERLKGAVASTRTVKDAVVFNKTCGYQNLQKSKLMDWRGWWVTEMNILWYKSHRMRSFACPYSMGNVLCHFCTFLHVWISGMDLRPIWS